MDNLILIARIIGWIAIVYLTFLGAIVVYWFYKLIRYGKRLGRHK
jgi:hypothetical protein